jgi:peptidylprolyl isomerase/FKBP-type peptidyl-prolyl cis-trans isomerase FklB
MRRLFALAAAAVMLAACQPKAGGETATATAEAEPNAEGAAFLAKNAKEPGVVTTPSGLQYKVIRSGPPSGPHPKPADEVRVHYEGTLVDGTVFDSSFRDGAPVIFTLGNLVPGWVEGIGLMRPGDEWYLYVPPKLGYGAEGKGPIPSGSVLVFRIQLLGVLQHSAAPGMG